MIELDQRTALEREAAKLQLWAKNVALPGKLVELMSRLPEQDLEIVREVAEQLSDEGYPWTANEVRKAFVKDR